MTKERGRADGLAVRYIGLASAGALRCESCAGASACRRLYNTTPMTIAATTRSATTMTTMTAVVLPSSSSSPLPALEEPESEPCPANVGGVVGGVVGSIGPPEPSSKDAPPRRWMGQPTVNISLVAAPGAPIMTRPCTTHPSLSGPQCTRTPQQNELAGSPSHVPDGAPVIGDGVGDWHHGSDWAPLGSRQTNLQGPCPTPSQLQPQSCWHTVPCCSTSVSHCAGSVGGGVGGGALFGAGVGGGAVGVVAMSR